MKIIEEAEIEGKNVLVRIDADVLGDDGEIKDDSRLEASIPTIKYLLEKKAKLVTIIGHIGRPEGHEMPELKMEPVVRRLSELLGTFEGWQVLENLRFEPGEEENDPTFAKELAEDQDIFIQDAFATCHREHASTVGVAKLLPSFAGFSVQKEVAGLKEILASPKEGFVIIIGGKKAEDKLPVIENLFQRAEVFLVGGVVGSTFLAGQGHNLGSSLVEEEVLDRTKKIFAEFGSDPQKKLMLPEDILLSRSIEEPIEVKNVSIKNEEVIDNLICVDIGRKTFSDYRNQIKKAKTIFWNGNMGVSEIKEFSKGTWEVAKAISKSRAKKYAGGGDTSSFIREAKLDRKFNFISNAGGASLEYLAGIKLPGLEALEA